MNIKHLQAFIYLGRCGTFKEAARVLYHEGDPEDFVTPEALQYRVKNLEESLGISLYEKRQGTARVQLTREGQLFLPEAITIYQRMLRWQLMFSESTRGHLAFASTELVLLHRLPDIVHTFHVNFPQIRLTMLARRKLKSRFAAAIWILGWRHTPPNRMTLFTRCGRVLT
jgi:DNA-binding transcriptional LysR family regulator